MLALPKIEKVPQLLQYAPDLSMIPGEQFNKLFMFIFIKDTSENIKIAILSIIPMGDNAG